MRRINYNYIVLLGAFWVACDSVQPETTEQLVVESYAKAGDPLPVVRLRRTLPLEQPYPTGETSAAAGATVNVTIGGAQFAYAMGAPGYYEPVGDYLVEARAVMALDITWQGHRALATTRVPPPLTLSSVEVAPDDVPLSGLLLDSLFLDRSENDTLSFYSLRTGVTEGFVYLVEVTVHWHVGYAEDGPDGGYWVRTQLRPYLDSRTKLDEYFLRPEQLLREAQIARDVTGLRAWTGIYAVPVESADASLPAHRLRIALVRGTQAYAQFVSGTGSPKHREPPTNMEGALGIFAGISVDSVSVLVE